MRYRFGCELSYDVAAQTLFVFHVEVARLPSHRGLRETLTLTPDLPRDTYIVPGTENRSFSVVAPKGPLSLRYEGSVELLADRQDPAGVPEIPVQDLPLEVMQFLLPSRFVHSDLLANFAHREFGGLEPGHGRVTAICNWIYDHLDYQRGASGPTTSAQDSLIARAGVCRDFAHLGVGFCRALHIPARFVSAYAYGLEPCDFHAVFEAYLGGRWWLFDATRQAALDGLVRIGFGRDAADVAFASIYGRAEPTGMRVFIEPETGSPPEERTVAAVSTA